MSWFSLIKKISELNHEILNDKNATEAYYILSQNYQTRNNSRDGGPSWGFIFIYVQANENNKGILYSIDLPQAEYEHERGTRDTTKLLPTKKIGVCEKDGGS